LADGSGTRGFFTVRERSPSGALQKRGLWALVVIYALTSCAASVVGNYQAGILLDRGFSADAIFWLSIASMLPAVPGPIAIGVYLDRGGCAANVLVGGLCAQAGFTTLFLYGTNAGAAYIGLIGLSLSGSFVLPSALMLISHAAGGLSAQRWNNTVMSAPVLLTLGAMMVPLTSSALPALFAIITAVNCVACLAAWFFIFRARAVLGAATPLPAQPAATIVSV
jgi:hypothetical protein